MVNDLLFFLQGIPETMGVIAFSLALVRVPLRWGRITAAGTVISVIIFIVRTLPVAFGMHLLAGILLTLIFMAKTTRVPLPKIFVAIFATTVVLSLFELGIHELFFALTEFDPRKVMADSALWTWLGLIQTILMNFLAVFISKLQKPFKDAWKR